MSWRTYDDWKLATPPWYAEEAQEDEQPEPDEPEERIDVMAVCACASGAGWCGAIPCDCGCHVPTVEELNVAY